MSKRLASLLCAGLLLTLGADGPKTDKNVDTSADPGSFKLVMEYHELQSLVAKGELVVHEGRIYQFLDKSDEVIVVDPARKNIRILDLDRQFQTAVSFAEIEKALAAYRKEIEESIAVDEKSASRADRIEAEMERNLIDPRFVSKYDAKTHEVSLDNPNIQVKALGVPESDPRRLALINDAIVVNVKLRTVRDEGTARPPFAMLDTVDALVAGKNLRPAEMTFVFRLASKPKKYRWVYRLVPSLTDRERAAISRIDGLFGRTKRLSFETYERGYVSGSRTLKK